MTLPIEITSEAGYVVPNVTVAALRSYPRGNLKTTLSFVPL
jgi:hypothetical protein